MQSHRMGVLSRALTPALLSVVALAACSHAPIFAEGEPEPVNDETINGYLERQLKLAADSQAVLAKCDDEKREPTAEEQTLIKANTQEVTRLQGLIETRMSALQQISALGQPKPRQTTPTGDPATPKAAASPGARPAFSAARDTGPLSTKLKDHGFTHFGEFSKAVLNSAIGRGDDVRLKNAAATAITGESEGASAGFLVPPEYRDRIMGHVFDENDLLSRTDQQITSRNSISFPVDETTPWGSSGVRIYWEAEAAAITQSRPSFKELTLKTSKLAALVPVTEELLEDAPSLGNYLDGAAGRGFNYAIGNAIIDGSGAGQPLGFLRSSALVTVAAEGSQTADTVNAMNVSKMYTRMPAHSRSTAIWLINPDVEQQMIVMTLGGSSVAIPVYMPPNGLSQSPFGTILGRPAVPHMACKALGDVGDINFVDLKQYVTAVKTGGVKADVSLHLWFDQALAAFRFMFRVDGRPWLSAPIDAPNSSNDLSPFIALGAR